MGSLLPYGSPEQPGPIEITLKNGARPAEAIRRWRIPKETVKLIFVNHTGVFLNQPLKDGDRVSLFRQNIRFSLTGKGLF